MVKLLLDLLDGFSAGVPPARSIPKLDQPSCARPCCCGDDRLRGVAQCGQGGAAEDFGATRRHREDQCVLGLNMGGSLAQMAIFMDEN